MEERFFKIKEEHKVANIFGVIFEMFGSLSIFYILFMLCESNIPGVFYGIFGIIINYLIGFTIERSFRPIYQGMMEVNGQYLKFGSTANGLKSGMSFTIDERLVSGESKKKEGIPQIIRVNFPKLKSVYVINEKLEDGKTMKFAWGNCNICYMWIDDVLVMQNDIIYRKKIDELYANTTKVEDTVVTAQQNTIPVTAPITNHGSTDYVLKAVSGNLAGESWILTNPVRIGRDSEACQIILPEDASGVSRVHCEIGQRNGELFVKDLGASFGTKLEDGSVIKNYQETIVKEGTIITVGDSNFVIIRV